jgi:lipopolysaccharide/colanic/teichoic acid biosynthesis glycosyltransferase
MKRSFDLLVAAILLVLFAPVMLLVAVWIRLDSKGPIIFRQIRVGRGEKPFEILKFRTMHDGAEGPFVAPTGDARVTQAGRWLRKSKLDELPQLWNVLRGDMSLVGPRPEVPRQVAHYPEAAKAIVFSIRPGITNPGSIAFFDEPEWLAQQEDPEAAYINVLMPKKLEIYARYARERTLLLDIGVLLRTLWLLIVKSPRTHEIPTR